MHTPIFHSSQETAWLPTRSALWTPPVSQKEPWWVVSLLLTIHTSKGPALPGKADFSGRLESTAFLIL